MKYHADQVHIDVALVRRLVREQFPLWREEPVAAVRSDGTVNAIFRIGEQVVARLPLRREEPERVEAWLRREALALTEFAEVSPFPAPRPVAIGAPGEGFPMPWAVQTWVPGPVATPSGSADAHGVAEDIAELILALRRVDVAGRTFRGSGRGGALQAHDAWMAECFAKSEGLIDVRRAAALWSRFRELPRTAPDAMCHGDLIPPNLLVDGGRVVGVLDAGGFAPADPALDLTSAWHLFDPPARETLRSRLGCDDLEWQRGAAWAFEQAMGLVSYYRRTNPGMYALGRSTLARILDAPDL